MLSAQPFCRSVANHKTFPYCINAHRVIVALRSLAQQMHINIFALLLCGHAVCVFACNRQQIFVTNYIEWLWSEWSEWMNLISIPAQPTWRGFPPKNCCTQPQWPTSTEHQGIRVNKFTFICAQRSLLARVQTKITTIILAFNLNFRDLQSDWTAFQHSRVLRLISGADISHAEQWLVDINIDRYFPSPYR